MRKINIIAALCVSLFVCTPAFSNDNHELQLDNAIKTVSRFMSAEDNVDTFENYWLVAKAVANIDPVNSRKKIDFLINVCRYYTPTDQGGANSLACDKIWYLGKKLAPKMKSTEYYSKNSPLYKLITK